LNTNIAMLPVRVQQLGITAATARFNYKVQVTRHDALGYTVNSESAWITYDVANPGIDASSGTATNEPFVLNGQPGQTLPVLVNQTNIQNNGSLGLLMVYPHNASGQHTQVIPAVTPLAVGSAVSRLMHGANAFDISLPGVECRNGSGNHTVVVSFNNNVVSGSASVGSGVGSVSGSPTFAGNTMSVNLTGVGNAQMISLNLSNVTDEFSQVLPNATINAKFLVGDTNGDAFVNAGDALQTRNRAGQAADTTNFRSDVNRDGFVNSGDTTIVRARSGDSVP
jgi:hypothetical protein